MEAIFLVLDLLKLSGFIGCTFLVYFLLMRKSIYSWFDPLFAYMFFNSFAIGLVLYLYFYAHMIDQFYLITFLLSVAGFITGIKLGSLTSVSRAFKGKRTNSVFNKPDFSNYNHYNRVLTIALLLSVGIIVFSNALLMAITGTVPILSANPSEAKVLLYSGNWGIVRRINFTLITVAYSIIFMKLLNPVNKPTKATTILLIVLLSVVTLVLLTTGSKGAILEILSITFPIYLINRVWHSRDTKINDRKAGNLKSIRKATKIVMGFAVSYMIMVVALTGGGYSVFESSLTRFIASGDTFYFFYVFDVFSDFHFRPIDYFEHILNPLLGMLRIMPYDDPIGALILQYSVGLPLSSFGPNSQHPIEGLIFFGSYFCFLYSMIIGGFISLIRFGLLRHISKKPNQLSVLIYVTLSSIVVSLATEATIFFGRFYDLIFWGVPIILLSMGLNQILLKKHD
jgi:hypothetical protein